MLPLKPVDFDRSIGTPCHRGSSKGRVGRRKEYFKLVLNAPKLKTQAPSRQIAEMPASAAFPGAHSLPKGFLPSLIYARITSIIKSLKCTGLKKCSLPSWCAAYTLNYFRHSVYEFLQKYFLCQTWSKGNCDHNTFKTALLQERHLTELNRTQGKKQVLHYGFVTLHSDISQMSLLNINKMEQHRKNKR